MALGKELIGPLAAQDGGHDGGYGYASRAFVELRHSAGFTDLAAVVGVVAHGTMPVIF